MEKKVKLSIIVPVYNVEMYIGKCIGSLLSADIPDSEILIVNDGTPDSSIDIVRKSFNDGRIRIVEQSNGGLSSARNRGISEAEGEYIWFFDSDDWAETARLKELVALLNDGPDIVYMNSFFRENETSGLSRTVTHDVKGGGMRAFLESDFQHSACMYLIRKEILLANNLRFKEGLLHEDSLFVPQLIAFCKSVSCYCSPVYHYLDRQGSITNTSIDRRVRDLAYISDRLILFGEENVRQDIRYKWGKCIASTLNEMMFLSASFNNPETGEFVKGFCKGNRKAVRYLFYGGFNNRIMAILATICAGNLYGTYRFLFKFRYALSR